MGPQSEEIYAKEIVAVKYTTYTVAKRKPEKFGLTGIGTLTNDIPLQLSNQLSQYCNWSELVIKLVSVVET